MSTVSRLLCAGVAFSLTFSPTLAVAKSISVLVRGVGAGSDKAAGFVQHFLQEALQRSEDYEVVNLPDVLGSPTQDRARRAFRTAQAMAKRGRRAYDTLDLDPAIDYLNIALNKYERYAAYVTDPRPVAEVLMLLGATHALRGEDRAGRLRLAQAVAIEPGIEPDLSVFNPAMRGVFKDAARQLADRPTGTLSITSNPSYARVYVNGRFVGVTPMALSDVTEGRHLVRLAKDGYRHWGRVIEVKSRVESTHVATMKPTEKFEEYEALAEAAMPPLPRLSPGDGANLVHRQLGDLLGVNELLVAEVRLDGERVRVLAVLVDLGKRRVVMTGTQVFSYDSRPETYRREIADLLRDFNDQAFSAGPDQEPAANVSGSLLTAATGECAGMPCSEFKTILLAVGAGGGCALAIAGGVLDYLAYVDNEDYKRTPQTSSRAEELKDAGQVKAISGDILLVVGLATAITAVSLYLFWDPTPAAEEVVSSGSWGWTVVPLPEGAAFSARIVF